MPSCRGVVCFYGRHHGDGSSGAEGKWRLVAACARKVRVRCGLRHQKLGILLLFNGCVIFFCGFFLTKEETSGSFKLSFAAGT